MTEITPGLRLSISDERPEIRLQRVLLAVAATFRWLGNMETVKLGYASKTSECIVYLSKLLECFAVAKLHPGKVEILIEDNEPSEAVNLYASALETAIEWYRQLDESYTYNVNGIDEKNVIQLRSIIAAIKASDNR